MPGEAADGGVGGCRRCLRNGWFGGSAVDATAFAPCGLRHEHIAGGCKAMVHTLLHTSHARGLSPPLRYLRRAADEPHGNVRVSWGNTFDNATAAAYASTPALGEALMAWGWHGLRRPHVCGVPIPRGLLMSCGDSMTKGAPMARGGDNACGDPTPAAAIRRRHGLKGPEFCGVPMPCGGAVAWADPMAWRGPMVRRRHGLGRPFTLRRLSSHLRGRACAHLQNAVL